MASSIESTTPMASRRSRYSSPHSASVAGEIESDRAQAAAFPTKSTPPSASTARGTNSAATSACTRSFSAALHTLGRCVLALTTIDVAMSRSAAESTYTWQLPSPSIT